MHISIKLPPVVETSILGDTCHFFSPIQGMDKRLPYCVQGENIPLEYKLLGCTLISVASVMSQSKHLHFLPWPCYWVGQCQCCAPPWLTFPVGTDMTVFTNCGLDEATGLPSIHVATFSGVLYMHGAIRLKLSLMVWSKLKTTLGARPIIFILCLESTTLAHMKVFWMKSRKANVVWQSHSGVIFIWGGFRACRFFVLLSTLLAMVWSGEYSALAPWMMGQTHIQIQICLGHFPIYLIQLPWRWREAVCSSKNLGHTIISYCNNCKWPSCDLSGHVNMQNTHIYGATKSLCHLMHVWKCTDHRPDKIHFQHTVNSGKYVSDTFNPFFNYPIVKERQKGHLCAKHIMLTSPWMLHVRYMETE